MKIVKLSINTGNIILNILVLNLITLLRQNKREKQSNKNINYIQSKKIT